MPETRYINEYDNNGNIINRIPYEVSDEQLSKEAEQSTCEEYLSHSPAVILPTEMWFLLRAFAKHLGYKVE